MTEIQTVIIRSARRRKNVSAKIKNAFGLQQKNHFAGKIRLARPSQYRKMGESSVQLKVYV